MTEFVDFFDKKRWILNMGIFLGGGWDSFFKKVNIFTYTCPNHSGVGAIDSPDRFEHVFDPYYTLEVHEKSFEFDISIVRP